MIKPNKWARVSPEGTFHYITATEQVAQGATQAQTLCGSRLVAFNREYDTSYRPATDHRQRCPVCVSRAAGRSR